jgi:hypothetical protein
MRNRNGYGYLKDNHVNSRHGNAHGFVNINYNPFDPLMDQNIVCCKCNNLGHKARYSRYMKEDAHIIKPTIVWERKENPNKEDFLLALLVKDKEDEWYIDSGFSTHITRDQNKFISFKKGKSGSVAFGNDSSVKRCSDPWKRCSDPWK